jgi:hypothetical protein
MNAETKWRELKEFLERKEDDALTVLRKELIPAEAHVAAGVYRFVHILRQEVERLDRGEEVPKGRLAPPKTERY